MKNRYEFKYQSRKNFNFTTPLFLVLFILSIIVLYKYVVITYLFIPALIALTILVSLWMYYVKDMLSSIKGIFEFRDKDFYYTTKKRTVAIDYNEVESITVEPYTDTFFIFKRDTKRYAIKIKNAGTFYFPFCGESLKIAIEELNNRIEEYIEKERVL